MRAREVMVQGARGGMRQASCRWGVRDECNGRCDLVLTQHGQDRKRHAGRDTCGCAGGLLLCLSHLGGASQRCARGSLIVACDQVVKLWVWRKGRCQATESRLWCERSQKAVGEYLRATLAMRAVSATGFAPKWGKCKTEFYMLNYSIEKVMKSQ